MNSVLAFDCCFDSCSVAWYADGEVIASAFEPMQRGQAERLPSMAAEVLGAAPADIDLDRVAVTTGPGTFTGVRIGLSFARAFALARGVSCLGLSSLEVVALGEGTKGVRAAIFPAAQGFYAAAYDGGGPLVAPGLFSLAELVAQLPDGPIAVAGAATGALVAELGERAFASSPELPDARALARLAAGRNPEAHPPHPLYLRAPDIRPSRRSLRQTGAPA